MPLGDHDYLEYSYIDSDFYVFTFGHERLMVLNSKYLFLTFQRISVTELNSFLIWLLLIKLYVNKNNKQHFISFNFRPILVKLGTSLHHDIHDLH